LIRAWSEQEATAQAERNRDEESMDIFDIRIEKGELPYYIFGNQGLLTPDWLGPSKADLQLQLLEEERLSTGRRGSSGLLAQALKIEESQSVSAVFNHVPV
jgi:hypothetical protein